MALRRGEALRAARARLRGRGRALLDRTDQGRRRARARAGGGAPCADRRASRHRPALGHPPRRFAQRPRCGLPPVPVLDTMGETAALHAAAGLDYESIVPDAREAIFVRAAGDEGFRERFLYDLESDEAAGRRLVLLSLAEPQDERALPLILPLLSSPRVSAILSAIEALESLGQPRGRRPAARKRRRRPQRESPASRPRRLRPDHHAVTHVPPQALRPPRRGEQQQTSLGARQRLPPRPLRRPGGHHRPPPRRRLPGKSRPCSPIKRPASRAAPAST